MLPFPRGDATRNQSKQRMALGQGDLAPGLLQVWPAVGQLCHEMAPFQIDLAEGDRYGRKQVGGWRGELSSVEGILTSTRFDMDGGKKRAYGVHG